MKTSKYVRLGEMYEANGKYEDAYKCFLEGAIGENDPKAMQKIAYMYLDDKYLSIDYEKAFRYLTLACNAGLTVYDVINLRIDFPEIRKDQKGVTCYRKFLNDIYDKEIGELNIWMAEEHISGVFGTDIEKFIDYCEKAGKAGTQLGYDLLGELYFKGVYVKRDYEKAYKYFTMSDADKTDIKLFYLGEMYRCGLYVKKDKEKAKYYLNQLMELLLDFDEEPKEDLMYYSRARASLKKLEEGIEEVI